MKNKKNSFKNVNETKIEEAKEECGMTKTSENKCEKTDFEEEPSKQNHSNEFEKAKPMQLWKKHEDLLKGEVRHYTSSKVKLNFKEGARKRHQCKPCGAAETHEKLMKGFLEDSYEQKVLRKANAVEC